MCLLALLSRAHPDAPLIVAANRDEWLSRPASPMQLLSDAQPRILGGKDERAGGTWLAVNERGVVAGLTNTPATPDPTRRSRGALPLLLTRHPAAKAAIEEFTAAVRPRDYNPCWLLVADRDSAFYLEVGEEKRPRVQELDPGACVLENRPLGAPSPKAARVRERLQEVGALRGDALVEALQRLLGSHDVPEGARELEDEQEAWRPLATHAACVHAGPYGTRSATVIVAQESLPRVLYADGPPCTARFVERGVLWGEALSVSK